MTCGMASRTRRAALKQILAFIEVSSPCDCPNPRCSNARAVPKDKSERQIKLAHEVRLRPLRSAEATAGQAPKCRVVNARPEPDFRYFSNRTAASSVENSIETTSDQGRY